MTDPKQLAKALDIPCLAVTQNGEEHTTLGKALGIDLAAQEMAKTVRSRKSVHVRESRRLLMAWKAQESQNAAIRRTRSLVKAQLRRRKVERIETETAGMLAKVEALNLAKAESEQALANAEAEKVRLTAEQDQLGARLNFIMSRLSEGQARIDMQKDLQVAQAAAREERKRRMALESLHCDHGP